MRMLGPNLVALVAALLRRGMCTRTPAQEHMYPNEHSCAGACVLELLRRSMCTRTNTPAQEHVYPNEQLLMEERAGDLQWQPKDIANQLKVQYFLT